MNTKYNLYCLGSIDRKFERQLPDEKNVSLPYQAYLCDENIHLKDVAMMGRTNYEIIILDFICLDFLHDDVEADDAGAISVYY